MPQEVLLHHCGIWEAAVTGTGTFQPYSYAISDLPEVEIISLLEEQLPHYKLRADTIYGYDHDDWLHTPLISPDANIDLTTEQIEETLKYFLLCAERVGQMTKTYNDIDAVTRLLEEKERDLELAARIGQSLLKKNKTLCERNEFLEEQVEHIREEVSQLRHELSMKDELLQFYTSAAEESEGESTTSTPIPRNESTSSLPSYFPLDSLQKKLKDLEEENTVLRSEACHLETETISYEEKEQQLVNDCVKELRDANLQISSIAEELAKKTEDASRQQEEITHLLSQIVDLQKKSKSYAVENEELTQHLGAAKDAQRQLTAELRELEEKYAECMEMLHEAQEELKNLRNKTLPLSTPRRFHSLGLFPMDSLAAEIEGTMRKELQMDDPEVEEQKMHHRRVFEAVKNINQTVRQRSLGPSPMNIPGSNQSSLLNSARSSCISTPRSSMYGSDVVNDNRANSIILENESPEGSVDDSNKKPGTPGTPGSQDLETALRRLSLRRENYLSGGASSRRTASASCATWPSTAGCTAGASPPPRASCPWAPTCRASPACRASRCTAAPTCPRSCRSSSRWKARPLCTTGSSWLSQTWGGSWTHGRAWSPKASGLWSWTWRRSTSSPTLRRMSQLRQQQQQPPRSVQERPPPDALEPQEPRLGAEELSVHYPGKCMSHTSSTYTFTTCRILHPSDELTRVTPSLASGPTASCIMSSSLKSTPVSTPRRLSLAESFTNLRDSTKTMSTSLGLLLLPYDNFLASRPASSILREVQEEARGQADCESQTDVSVHNLRLVDKLKRFGVAQTEEAGPGAVGHAPLLGPLSGLRRPRPLFGHPAVTSTIGGLPALNAGIRRNRSYPAMVGASMVMKGPGPPSSDTPLQPKLPKQTSLK
ncbi:hypothetical protein ANANG_G00011680 [Anguilla anguilla]|uniref:HAP1 N-terminal domain-containing protein n=1 Tax=Anguilla anguilla TaxID=7936 RepID=A0A9D3N0T9_ANGAN|nr:hypothetical protein ANANG_G00011680 [Anguilla anguilla]